MTHLAETFTHDVDPPPAPRTNYIWPDEEKEIVRSLWVNHSATQIAERLTAQFNRPITRNQIIGLVTRAGLGSRSTGQRISRPRPRREKAKRNPVLRFVASNGHFKSMRIMQTVAGEVGRLRCADVEPLHISILELNETTCHYPYGDGPYTYCGLKVAAGAYCIGHAHLCYIPPRSRA